jgi:hypothetical protein
MTAVDIAIAVLALLLTAAISIDLAAPAIAEYLRQRRVVRQSALDSQMQAMRAAQQLSLVAWKAPHDLDQPSRATKRALAQVPGHGMVAAAKVDAAVFVTRVAIQEVGMLSIEEALLVERAPHAAAQVKALVDAYIATVLRGYQP